MAGLMDMMRGNMQGSAADNAPQPMQGQGGEMGGQEQDSGMLGIFQLLKTLQATNPGLAQAVMAALQGGGQQGQPMPPQGPQADPAVMQQLMMQQAQQGQQMPPQMMGQGY